MAERLFDVSEANRTLPLVRRIVQDILSLGREMRAYLALTKDPVGDEKVQTMKKDIVALMEELEEIGCFYKDWSFDVGLVDFPARVDDEDVYLCWRSDETEIGWYHGREVGYAGRTRIPPELLAPGEN